MEQKNTQNAVAAILDEYKKAINELQNIIADITDKELVTIVDPVTSNTECKSVQTILTHVVSSGYSYCVYIQNHRNIKSERPGQKFNISSQEYIEDLERVMEFTRQTFIEIYDYEPAEINSLKRIETTWGQAYDIEQMMEHAIVHILRHRRQIEHFRKVLRST